MNFMNYKFYKFLINGEYEVKPQGIQIDHVALSYGYGNKKTKEFVILFVAVIVIVAFIIFISSTNK